MGVSIVGLAHSPFGRLEAQDLESLITGVARQSMEHAGITASEVEAIWLGQLNGGFVPEIFASSLALQADDGLRWWPHPCAKSELRDMLTNE